MIRRAVIPDADADMILAYGNPYVYIALLPPFFLLIYDINRHLLQSQPHFIGRYLWYCVFLQKPMALSDKATAWETS